MADVDPAPSAVPMLLQLVRDGRLDASLFRTHDFKLGEMMNAYDVFANAATHDALKALIKR